MSVTPLLDPPTQQRDDGVWSYISPSRLSLWLKCPLAFRFRYIGGIRTPTTSSRFLGKVVHKGLEIYYRHRMLGISLAAEDVTSQMDAVWDAVVAEEEMSFGSTDEEAALKKQAANLVTTYLGQVPADEPRPIAVEATMQEPLVDPGTGQHLGIDLLGIVDLVLDGPGGAVIVDFKTSARSAPPMEVSHEIQLTSYGYLFRRLTGQREAGLEIRSLIKTKTPKIDPHSYPARTGSHFDRLFAVIREYLNALDKGVFNFRPGWGCSMCDFRETECRRWCG